MNVAFAELEQHAEALDFSGVDVENRAVADCGDAGGAHHGWDAEFAGDDRGAAQERTAVAHNGDRTEEARGPRWVGDRAHQDIAGFEPAGRLGRR